MSVGLPRSDVVPLGSEGSALVVDPSPDGNTDKEIAELVDVSTVTVRSHRARVGRTPGTGDRAHLVALGSRSGVIS